MRPCNIQIATNDACLYLLKFNRTICSNKLIKSKLFTQYVQFKDT